MKMFFECTPLLDSNIWAGLGCALGNALIGIGYFTFVILVVVGIVNLLTKLFGKKNEKKKKIRRAR